MKKGLFTIIVLILCEGITKAQVAKWIILPEYDDIYKEKYADVLKAKLPNGVTTIWSLDGKQLIKTSDYLAPFHEGLAISTEYEGNYPTAKIKGLYTEKGKFIQVRGSFSLLNNDFQQFSDGQLLVKDENNNFRFLSYDGTPNQENLCEALPFFNGFASCATYEKWEKKKGKYNVLLNKDLQHVGLSYKGKLVDNKDITFISSVNDEGVGIVVANNTVYYFSASSNELSPVYANERETNKKNLAEDVTLSVDEEGKTILRARTHKTHQEITILFDEFMLPEAVQSDELNQKYKRRETPKWNHSSLLKQREKDGMWGIWYKDSIEVLPPQFKRVKACYSDNAIVVMPNGKYGILQVFENKDFGLKLNDNEAIPFKHEKFKTKIRLDLPTDISSDNTRIEVLSNGLDIDERTEERRNTESGNYVQYDCTLTFPDSLPNELDESKNMEYYLQVQYHQLTSPVIPLKVQAWHFKYFDLVISNEQVNSNGTATFIFDINIPSPEDRDFKRYVTAQNIDSVQIEIESISATKYKCTVSNLIEGINNIVIKVQEGACPPMSLPYEITYTKPAPRKRETPKISIQKKTKTKPIEKPDLPF